MSDDANVDVPVLIVEAGPCGGRMRAGTSL
jgi:hypothetical protein